MATILMRQTLALMASPAIRDANDGLTALVVLSADLSAIVWANSAGAETFGLASTGPQDHAETPARIRDQLAGSRGIFARKGRASLLLRIGGGFRAASIPGELRLIAWNDPDGDGDRDVALLTVPASRAAYGPAERDAALLTEAGLSDTAEARLLPTETAAGELSGGDDLAASAKAASFVSSESDLAEFEPASGGRALMARIAADRLLILPIDEPADELPPVAEAEAEADAAVPAAEELVSSQSAPAKPAARRVRRLHSVWGSAAPAPVSAKPETDEPSAAAIASGEYAAERDMAAPAQSGDPADDDLPQAPDEDGAATDDVSAEAGKEMPSPPKPLAGEPEDASSEPKEEAPPSPAGADQGPPQGLSAETATAQPADDEDDDDDDSVEPVAEPEASGAAEDQDGSRPEESESSVREDADPPEDGHKEDPAPETEEPVDGVRPLAASDFEPSADAGDEPAKSEAFSPQLGGEPVRFVWRIDSEGRFRSLSPEFAAAVGPVSAAILDRSVDEVARAYGLDGDGALRRLLSRRETWSGRTVMWPLEKTAKTVPVDLAALPVYARDRSFDGFRGFGIVRLADAEDDPAAIGLDPNAAFETLAEPEAVTGESESDSETLPAFIRTIGASPPVNFGRREPERRPEAPQPSQAEGAARHDMPQEERRDEKVIRLEERRRPANAGLSQTEEAAFRAIGETLAQGSDPRDLVEAVRAASERIEEFESRQSGEADAPDASSAEDQGADPALTATEPSGEPRAGSRDLASVLDQVYGTLPLPILAQAGTDLVYANREFLDLTGHDDLAGLRSAGGLDGLVLDRMEGDADRLRLRRANGTSVAIRARMQRTSVEGVGCLIFSFFASPRLAFISHEKFDTAEGSLPGPSAESLADPILDLAADGIVLVDDAGMTTAMSGAARELFDIAPADVAGRPFVTLFAHESQKAIKVLLTDKGRGQDTPAKVVEREAKWFSRIDVIGRVAGGGFLPLAVSLGQVPGSRGYCAVIHDITRWKRAEETAVRARAHAEASNLQKSTFLSEVAQEIRDPVDAIIGFADLIVTESLGSVGNERYLEYLEDIKRSGHQVIDLVTILHDLAQVESGEKTVSFEAVSLAEIVAEVTAVMAPKANRQRVIVRTHLPSSVPPVVGDHDTIRQITTNLVANSIRSTPAGGQLIVSLKYEPELGVSLRFRDTGVGMRQDEIETALRGPGTGRTSAAAETSRLGLPLTKALAEANRAEFSIASTPGEGTLVEVRFPPARVLLD
ncbi:ATP-binding protein [Jiella mangrovi]|uniref:histidine kinase n=1 Tax=Jiella mangrovi TaxID=2821407 RepID=A0ABS4BDS6_9HYPH|nr:ATP-binding protein [Jiella mangrovi]MBP0614893.1 PAS domain S-box protein [Jiella mangrovi]